LELEMMIHGHEIIDVAETHQTRDRKVSSSMLTFRYLWAVEMRSQLCTMAYGLLVYTA